MFCGELQMCVWFKGVKRACAQSTEQSNFDVKFYSRSPASSIYKPSLIFSVYSLKTYCLQTHAPCWYSISVSESYTTLYVPINIDTWTVSTNTDTHGWYILMFTNFSISSDIQLRKHHFTNVYPIGLLMYLTVSINICLHATLNRFFLYLFCSGQKNNM